MTASSERSAVTSAPDHPDPERRVASADTSGVGASPRRATLAICPYLLAAGNWRSAEPSREHRCTAVEPPAVLALDKQRRLCLDAVHFECPTYVAATLAHTRRVGARRSEARFVRTAPTVIERARPALSLPDRFDRRRGSQAGLVALMLVAVAAIVVARLPAGPVAMPSAPPASSAPAAVASPSPTSTPPPSESVAPATPLASPVASGSVAPSASPASSGVATGTYKVKSGDTLLRIAARFGTTVAAIQELNGIKDARLIRVGQVLRIP